MNQFSQYINVKEPRPYETEDEAVKEILLLVDALCCAVFTIRDLWEERLEMRGVVITPSECREALIPPGGEQDGEEADRRIQRERLSADLRELYEYLAARGAVSSVRVWTICREFGLNSRETLCLFLALAPEFNRKYERLYGYIQDNVAARQPTLGLGFSLCELVFQEEPEHASDNKTGDGAFESLLYSGLLKWVPAPQGESRLSAPMTVGDTAWSYIREETWFGGSWRSVGAVQAACFEPLGIAEGQGGRKKACRLLISLPGLYRLRREENRSARSMAGELAAAYKGLGAISLILEYEKTEGGREELEEEAVYLHRLLTQNGVSVEYGTGAGMERLNSFCVPVRTIYTWEDLILDQESRHLLRQICNQVKYRFIVKEQWGFGKKDPYGNGISSLFFGPPGTGKTMAAQVIAGELCRELYKVDVSRLLSKYIGETERHVSALFDAASRTGAILFFDEADGLFARRSEVGNSNDRYANMETGFLLQKLEEYDGISILATNFVNNIDDAFKRRIRFLIRFPFPSPEMRILLWKRMIPIQAAVDEELRLEIPAVRFELSGSNIREVAIQAAYLAAADGRGIRRTDIGEALKLHYVKYGKNLGDAELTW